MSRKDRLAKLYASQADVFADIANLALFDGDTGIDAENSTELDTAVKGKRRDILKKCVLKNGETVMIGIENQSYVDPVMPIRILCYDADIYEMQVKKKQKENDKSELKRGEFLSGIKYTDRFIAVYSIVFNLSTEKWHGPKNIAELVNPVRQQAGYPIIVLDPSELSEEKIRKCRSEAGKLLMVLKYSQDKEKMLECLKRKEYEEVEEQTARMIQVFTGLKMRLRVKEGKVNMCKGLQEHSRDCRKEGEKIGIEKGIEKGMKKANLMNAEKMLESGLTEELILKCCQISKAELKKLKLKMNCTA